MITKGLLKICILVVSCFIYQRISYSSPITQSISWKCLETLPVDLEICYTEFISSERSQEDWQDFLKNRDDITIYYDKHLDKYLIEKKTKDSKLVYSYKVPLSGKASEKETLEGSKRKEADQVPYLKSGGFLNIFSLQPFLQGHYDVTKVVLEVFKFKSNATEIVADASRDPDFFSWNNDLAHAQTPLIKGDVIVEQVNYITGAKAANDFINYMTKESSIIKENCDTNERFVALYHMGVGLHAIQDLASHKGRTLAEHSWNSYCKNTVKCNDGPEDKKKDDGDPDEIKGNIELAKNFSDAWLKHLRKFVGDQCWNRLKTYNGNGESSVDYFIRLGLKKDLTIQAYEEYKGFSDRYAKLELKALNSVRWYENNDQSANAFIERIGLAMKNTNTLAMRNTNTQ